MLKKLSAIFVICALIVASAFADVTVSASDDNYDVEYVDIVSQVSEIIDNKFSITVYLQSDFDINVGGIQFALTCMDDYSFSYDSIQIGEKFSSATSRENNGYLKFLWDSTPGVSLNGSVELFSVTYNVLDTCEDGPHSFYLRTDEFYDDQIGMNDIVYYFNNEIYDPDNRPSETQIDVYVGDQFEFDTNSLTLVYNTDQDLSLYLNKVADNWSSSNDDIVTVDENGYLKAVSIGAAIITATRGSYEQESASILIRVIDRSIFFLNIKTNPHKMDYAIGQTVNLSGLSLIADYDNNDREILTEGFVAGEYDFSTPGIKNVKVYYGKNYVYLSLTVHNVEDIFCEDYDICDRYIKGITANTSVSAFLQKLNSNNIIISVNETEIKSGVITTGMTVNLVCDECVVDSYITVVKNDINSDGEFDIRDVVRLKKAATGSVELNQAQLIAGGIIQTVPSALNIVNMTKNLISVN